MRVLIVGCGYVGRPLGKRLVRDGHEVYGLRRSEFGAEALRQEGIIPLVADVTNKDSLAALPGDFQWVVNTVSSTRGGVDEYRQVYLEGTRLLLDRFAGKSICKYVYTGSTSVYGQTDGSEVLETSPTEPASATSQVLVEVENFLSEASFHNGFPAVVLRVAGIYGPGRGHLFLQYLRGEARIHGQGERLINMIHREDVVGGIIRALEFSGTGEVYNLVDDQPVCQGDFFEWLAGQLARPMPPRATAEENARRKRGLTQKKVSNTKIKLQLGWKPIYATFREGYAVEIERMRSQGLLD